MFEIAPSILSADFTRLYEEIGAVKDGGASVLHVDVMDGQFVPNITIGLPVVKSLRKATEMTIDCHLMIKEPSRYAVDFVEAGADMVSVHVEADVHLHRTLTAVREAGAKSGVAINPGTQRTHRADPAATNTPSRATLRGRPADQLADPTLEPRYDLVRPGRGAHGRHGGGALGRHRRGPRRLPALPDPCSHPSRMTDTRGSDPSRIAI